MAYHYETDDAFDLDWSREVMDKLSYKFEDEDIITHYDIESYKGESGGYGPSYRVYYIEFSTSNLDYELKLDDEYTHWVLSEDGKYIGEFYSGLDSEYNSDSDSETYTVDIDIQELNDWIIKEIEEYDKKAVITNDADDLIDSVNELDNFDDEDKVKLIKYLMKKLDVSIDDLK